MNRYKIAVKVTHVVISRNLFLKTLALTGLSNDLTRLGGGVKRRTTGKDSPVIEDRLREGLSTSGGTEISVETERLVDGHVSLDGEERSTDTLLLSVDVTTTTSEDTVDTTHSLLGNLDLDVEDRLLETGLGKEGSGVEHTTSGGDNLTTTTVDSVSVEGHVHDVEADRAHRLLSNRTFTSSPLETGNDGVLDFVQVLDSLGLVNEQVGTGGVRTESPDLTGIGNIPTEVISKETSTGLEIVTGSDLAGLDGLGDLLAKGLSLDVETVVLVGGLGQGSHAGLATDSLTVLGDRVRDTEGNTSVVFLKILQANFQVKFTGTGNDVLTRLVDGDLDTRVGLGETLKTFDKLGQIVGVLDLDGTTHDRGDRELHDLQVVGSLRGGKGTRLEQELVNTDETDDVTGGDILNGLNETTHHENGTLDSLDGQVLLLTRSVVRTLDTDLKTGPDGTGEDTTESEETTLIGGGHHLGDVKHERTLGVTVTDGNAGLVIGRTLVQGLGTVLLSSNGGRKVENHHLHESVSSRQELAHDNLQESLALEVLLIRSKLDLELINKSGDFFLLVVSNGSEDLEDGVQDELVESTLELLALVCVGLGPLLGLGVEEVVAL